MAGITLKLIINAILLGVGLAMDAFSVSVATGLAEPFMEKSRVLKIAGTFAGFQFAMPMIGWFCVHAAAERFEAFQKYIPWIAFVLLVAIGGKMIVDAVRSRKEEDIDAAEMSGRKLFVLGIATSIDALSVGFAIAEHNTVMAFVTSIIIGVVTLAICAAGLVLGKRLGERFTDKAGIFGGIILILIGLEILIGGI